MASEHAPEAVETSQLAGTGTVEDDVLRTVARLMEGGQEDADTCCTLDKLTKLLEEIPTYVPSGEKEPKPLHLLIDQDGFETILGELDMREGPTIRGHAILTLSAYLKAAEQKGTEYLTNFFHSRISKGTYDDFIMAFSVAACIFPIVPAISAELFLSSGFVNSLGSLMKRKWKSKKVELACLEMLNAACMDAACREAIQKYCTEWLEEILAKPTYNASDLDDIELHPAGHERAQQLQNHTEVVKSLAAVILAKLKAVSSSKPDDKVQHATTTVEELTDIFAKSLTNSEDLGRQTSVEGLAYASLQPAVKEKIASDSSLLKGIIQELSKSPPKSATTYAALTILVNLTSYLPTLSAEQQRMSKLKAYANASPAAAKPNPLNDDDHARNRGTAVFEAGAIPVLVTHSQKGSLASLELCVSILFALSANTKIRGRIAQQGGVKLLLHAYTTFPESNVQARRKTAHALARILISTNPAHVFGGSNPLSLTSAIRPLLSLLSDDPTSEERNLLPVFESLLALTNLASIDDSTRNPIIKLGWSAISEHLLSNNTMVTRAVVELICNLMQSPEGVAKFADGSKQASHMMHLLLALSDSEDFATRRAAGGALASLTEWDTAVNAILERDRGVQLILRLCTEEEEEMRNRGVVCVLNILTIPGKVGDWGIKKMKEEGAVEVLKECLKKSRSQPVLEITVEALQKLMKESR